MEVTGTDLGQGLVFMQDPFSAGALIIAAVAAGNLVWFGLTYIRVAGTGRGILLLALRLVALCLLAFVLLKPAMVEYRTIDMQLSGRFADKVVHTLDSSVTRKALPPASALRPPTLKKGTDVAIEEVMVPPVAFFKAETLVKVRLLNRGDGQKGLLKVYRGPGSGTTIPVASEQIDLAPGRQDVGFRMVPDETGRLVFRVQLEVAGDTENSNNEELFVLNVVRDSLRVLHLAGHASWDVRFMRQMLTQEAGLDLVSFYLLVDQRDYAPHSKDELALIPFPTDDIFNKEIGNFDLIILHNFPLGTYFLLREDHIAKLVSFIKEGGALLIMGGDRSFQLGKVENTPLGELLPVDLDLAEGSPAYIEGAFDLEWTTLARTHAVTRRCLQEEQGLRSRLPRLGSVNALGRMRPGGIELAGTRWSGEHHPIVAVNTAGKGRIMVIGTDSLWNWAFSPETGAGAGDTYKNLFRDSFHWLTRDWRGEDISVVSLVSEPEAGKSTKVRACGTAPSGQDGSLELKARWVDTHESLQPMVVQMSAPIDENNCGVFELPAVSPGVWSVDVEGKNTPYTQSGHSTVLVKRQRQTYQQRLRETVQPLLDMVFLPLAADPTFVVSLQDSAFTLQQPVITPFHWQSLVFIAFAFTIIFEWFLRRRWGYL